MPDIDVEVIKQEVISLLVSAKNGLTEHELLTDFRLFNSNRDLPYKELGFRSLVDLLRSWPDVCRVQSQGSHQPAKIFAVEEENTKHILSMVREQRQGKSRRRGRAPIRGQNRGGKRRGGGRSRSAHEENHGDPRTGRFSRGSFHSDRNRGGNGAGRGGSNNRMNFHVQQSDPRSMGMSRSDSGTFQQNSKKKPTAPTYPQPNKHQQPLNKQQKTQPTVTMKPLPDAYPKTALANDRQVNNDHASLRITIPTSNHYSRQTSQEEVSHIRRLPSIERGTSRYDDDEAEYNDDAAANEEQVLNNLRSLLSEHPYGVRLIALDQLYRENFGQSLLQALKIPNILLLQEYVEEFASIFRHGDENGSCDHIITLKDPAEVAQTRSALLQQITHSGVVPSTFFYATNLISFIKDAQFQGYISDIARFEHCLYIQPARYRSHIETLMEELNAYYSTPISDQLMVEQVETGLACVTTFHGVYHRAFIKETDVDRCVIVYVDYGTIEEVDKNQRTFKHLLHHFAELPCMALDCRLDDVFLLPDDHGWSPEAYQEVSILCQGGPYFIEHTGMRDGLLTVRILDADHQCFNDMLIDWKFAMRLSTMQQSQAMEANQPSRAQPMMLNFDFLDCAANCPLPPDSDPSTPDLPSNDYGGAFPEIFASAQANQVAMEHRCKLILVDHQTSFFLIQSDMGGPLITCFDLARLLNRSESEILSETSLSRVRLTPADGYRSVFDFIAQSNPKHCAHFYQQNLFVFDLKSVVNYLNQVSHQHRSFLIDLFQTQIEKSNSADYWNAEIEDQSSYQASGAMMEVKESDRQRYHELLQRRRTILCDIVRTTEVNQSIIELESIENELRQLIKKLHVGASTEPVSQISSTPSPYLPGSNKQTQSQAIGTDKLRDLMQRCKTLISTILTIADYVAIDDQTIDYIQSSAPYLNSDRRSNNEEQLYVQYSELLKNLTSIVNDLRQRLPIGVNIA